MNSNTWAHGPTYPLPETKFEKWYLTGGGKANTSKGDGKLTREPPGTDGTPDTYTYDPGDPTPDPRFFEAPKDKDGKELPKAEQKKREKAHHADLTAERKDVLVFTTEPFKEGYTFAGPVSAVLCAASSARDTDWHVRLVEVDEKGELFLLCAGKLRARFRKSMSKPELIEPDTVYEYQIDIWQTGLTVKAGGRLRVEVASAAFPPILPEPEHRRAQREGDEVRVRPADDPPQQGVPVPRPPPGPAAVPGEEAVRPASDAGSSAGALV